MKKLLTILLLSLALLNGAAYAADQTDPQHKPSPLTVEQATQLVHEGKPVYSCGMKPTWFSDQPGQCPCCTMPLMKVKDVKDGKAVFEENKGSMNMNMEGMGMEDMPMKDMKMMEKK